MIDVDEGGGGRGVRPGRDRRRLRLEAPAALVVEERHAGRTRGQQVRQPVVVVVPRHRHPRVDPGEARLLRDVGEPALLVAEHAEPRPPGRDHVERPVRVEVRENERRRAGSRLALLGERHRGRLRVHRLGLRPGRGQRLGVLPLLEVVRPERALVRAVAQLLEGGHRLLALLALAGAGEGHPEVVGSAHVVRLGRERQAEGGGRLLELPRLQVHLAQGHVGAEVLRVLLEHPADVRHRVLGAALAARDEREEVVRLRRERRRLQGFLRRLLRGRDVGHVELGDRQVDAGRQERGVLLERPAEGPDRVREAELLEESDPEVVLAPRGFARGEGRGGLGPDPGARDGEGGGDTAEEGGSAQAHPTILIRALARTQGVRALPFAGRTFAETRPRPSCTKATWLATTGPVRSTWPLGQATSIDSTR